MPSPNLNFWHLFLQASLSVQAIIVILAIMFVMAVFLIWKKWILFKFANHQLKRFERLFWSGTDINQLANRIHREEKTPQGLEAVFLSGFKEFWRLKDHLNYSPELIASNAKSAMFSALLKEETHLNKNLPWLATTASVAPYIGLLGTVIGIMNSFIALGAVKQVTLAQVAPGISEALIATAIGLFAAIPASMAYNQFSNHVNKLLMRYDSFIDEFANILSRQYIHLNQNNQRSTSQESVSTRPQSEERYRTQQRYGGSPQDSTIQPDIPFPTHGASKNPYDEGGL